MKTGIYRIRQLSSGRCYVGQSTNIPKRRQLHRSSLARGTHHSLFLQRAWNKSGPEDFAFETVVLCPSSMLDDLEQCLLDDLSLSPFNTSRDAKSPNRGRSPSAETRAKISAAGKGRVFSSETRAKLKAANLARKPPSDKTRAKMSASAIIRSARGISAETRAKIQAAGIGRRHTPETLTKMRGHVPHNKGVSPSQETRAKQSAKLRGRRMSAETIERMRAAAFLRWKKRKAL